MSGRRHNDTVLIYHDIRLKEADVEILRGPHWLTDQIIAFYFQYLESEVYRDYMRDFLFVSPQITQLIKMIDGRCEDARLLLEPLHPNTKKFLFFPVNDSEHHDKEGGTHWSLVVFSRPENTFYSFDSVHNRNKYATTKIIEVLRSVLNCQSAFFISSPSTQQPNLYDCGIYVICNVENIIKHILTKSGVVRHVAELNKDAVSTKRSEILKIIAELGGNYACG